MKDYNKNNISRAKYLRKTMTPEERKLWFLFLKTYSIRFRRQQAIGNYIVDFYCAKSHLAVEIDGSQHFEDNGLESDAMRTNELQKLGVQMIRFSNREINDEFKAVCQQIDVTVHKLINKK